MDLTTLSALSAVATFAFCLTCAVVLAFERTGKPQPPRRLAKRHRFSPTLTQGRGVVGEHRGAEHVTYLKRGAINSLQEALEACAREARAGATSCRGLRSSSKPGRSCKGAAVSHFAARDAGR